MAFLVRCLNIVLKVHMTALGTLSRDNDDNKNGTNKQHSPFLNKITTIYMLIILFSLELSRIKRRKGSYKVEKEKGKIITMQSPSTYM